MASGYTRVFSKVTGNTIQAADFNNEFQLIDDAFSEASGHKHDGSTNEGAYIPKISDTNNYTCVEIDSANAEIDFNINVSSAKVRQLVLTDGALLPSVDNDVDLGSTTFEFKNLYIDGVAYIDGVGETLNPSANGTIDLGSSSLQWHELFVRDFIKMNGVGGSTSGIQLQLNSAADAYIQVFDAVDPNLLIRKQVSGGGSPAAQIALYESGLLSFQSDADTTFVPTGTFKIQKGSSGLTANTNYDDLVIESTSNFQGISFLSNSGAGVTQGIAFGDSGSLVGGLFYYNHTSDYYGFFSDAKAKDLLVVSGAFDRVSTATDTDLYVGASAKLVVLSPPVPASAAATGTKGEIAYDTNYIYVCVATDTWKRAALSTW